MVDSVQNPKNGALIRIAGASLLASLAAACAGDTERFASNPFANPFQSDPVQTGSLPPASEPHPMPAPSASVARAPLSSPVARAPLSSPVVATAPAATPVRAAPITGSADGWSARGGTSVTVAQGDTLQNLSNRFGVPTAALASANGLKPGAPLAPGSRIVIPVYSTAGGAHAPAQPMTARSAPVQAPSRAVASTPRPAPAAEPRYRLAQGARPAEQMVAPKPVAAKAVVPAAKPAPVSQARDVVAKQVPARPDQKIAAVETRPAPQPKAVAVAPKPVEAAPPPVTERVSAPVESAPAAAESAGNGDFRWPARGRVISGFSAKSNEGINIAVPEGTPVKAAESGVVAYAGNELKGYGNLVLIRHDNGWVSAYANNGEITVKRGEKVKRGQTIAKSGQTGNVSSPQLHFELRKGATPVDPMPHLAGG